VSGAVPFAVTVKVAVLPDATDVLAGCAAIVGATLSLVPPLVLPQAASKIANPTKITEGRTLKSPFLLLLRIVEVLILLNLRVILNWRMLLLAAVEHEHFCSHFMRNKRREKNVGWPELRPRRVQLVFMMVFDSFLMCLL